MRVLLCPKKIVRRVLWLLPAIIVATGFAGEMRLWTAVVAFAQMSAEDVRYIREWRVRNRRAPLVDPERIALWPTDAVAENLNVRAVREDAAGTKFSYESRHQAGRAHAGALPEAGTSSEK